MEIRKHGGSTFAKYKFQQERTENSKEEITKRAEENLSELEKDKVLRQKRLKPEG